jgi:hypothetical protein
MSAKRASSTLHESLFEAQWQPIGMLPVIGSMIDGWLDDVEVQYQTLEECRPTPHILDGYTVRRVVEVYSAQHNDVPLFEEQLRRWRALSLTPTEREEVDRLAAQMLKLKNKIGAILTLAGELKSGTIEAVLARSDFELGQEFLMKHRHEDGAAEKPTESDFTSRHPKGSARHEPRGDRDRVVPLLPKLTVNRTFMRDFIAADTPCFALAVVEERKEQRGFLALRPDRAIPPDISSAGFRFGHSLLGGAHFEVVHFAFDFYGFATYNALVNPNNPLVRRVLTLMVEGGDYFFLALDSHGRATAFRSKIGRDSLAALKANLARIRHSRTTDAQYRKAVSSFERNPDPPGTLLNWVCGDDAGYLDLTADRLDLNPA